MAVFRVERTRDYTVMCNHHLKDSNLSLKAKGLLSMMLSLPDEWNYTTRGLAAICKEGVDAIGKTLKELELAGYIIRRQLRGKDGRISDTEYTIFEKPRNPSPPDTTLPDTENPYLDNPDTEAPDTDNPAQLNTKKSNTQKSNTDLSSTHSFFLPAADGMTDGFEKKAEIREQIEYDILCQQYDRMQLDELVEIMPAPSLYVHVALYIRLSVEDNKKRGCSVENQKLVLNDFLSDKPDFVVYDTYIDNGATGTNFHRPGFQQMLSDIEAGHINCVIVKDLSRLGRNSIDTGYYIEQYFHAHNVRFIAVTDQFDTADSGNLHGGIMLPLKNMINEAYALDIGRKIKAQARQAMKDGDYIGARAPYGYRKDPDNCHKLLIDENTAPVVKQIFEWAHEHVSLNRIVRNLNEMGIPAPSHYKKTTGEITSPGLIGSGKWQTRTVMKILESEVYTGDLVQGKTKIVDHQQVKAGEDNLIIAKCTHEPIISYELFNAVQEYRKQICEESKATPKRPYTPNIFKGKVFCADCGRSLHRQRAERRKGPDTYWFHCLTNSRVEKDSCKGATMQEKELISTVTAILEKELTVALGMSLPLFQLEARQKHEKDKLKIQMSAKRQEIEKTRRLIRGLYENFVQGILTNDEYFELKADYEYAINALSGEIEAFEKSMDSLDNQLARYRAMEKDAKALAQDHLLTAELIERIEIDHERNIHVTFRFKNEFQGKAVEPCTTM